VAGYGDSGSTMTAFPWSPSTGYILLGTLGGANSYAMTINDSGAAGGAAQTASGALHAVIWSGGSIRDLGTLGGANSFAYGLNNSVKRWDTRSSPEVDGRTGSYMTPASCWILTT